MHVRARDYSAVFYKHFEKKFTQIRPVVLPESCRQVEKISVLRKTRLNTPEERLERSENSFFPLMRSFDGKEGFYLNSKALN